MFLLIIRIGSIVFALPLLSSRNIPGLLKISLVLFLSFGLYPVIKDQRFDIPDSLFVLSLLAITEIVIGFVAQIFFVSIRLTGDIISQQVGLSIATILDSQYNYPSSIVSNFYYILSVLLFFALSAHHWFVLVITESLRLIPILGFNPSKAIGITILDFFARSFLVAIQITAPVIVVLLLITIGVGVIARLVPQMNIFILSLPVNLGAGLLFIALTLSLFLKDIKAHYYQLSGALLQIVRLMSQG
jgi:flagellar biosynthesis protein FliR